MLTNHDIQVLLREESKEKSFWEQFSSINETKTSLPNDKNILNPDFSYGEYEYILNEELSDSLLCLGKNNLYSLQVIFNTVIATLVHKYSGQKDLMIFNPLYRENLEDSGFNHCLPVFFHVETSHFFSECQEHKRFLS